jgi:hypothetical protein
MPREASNPAAQRALLRYAIVALALVETTAYLVVIAWALNEGPGFKIMTSIALASGFVYVLLVVPALVLAAMDRFLWLALALSLAPFLVWIWARFG